MRRALLALALLGAVLSAGCLQPFRVHVDEGVLAQANGWTERVEATQGGGLGARTRETRYTFDPPGSNPPFPGTLQVFSVRALDSPSGNELLQLAEQAVEDGAREHAIAFDGTRSNGDRAIESGVRTQWVLRSGTTTQSSAVFDDEVELRVLAEVGHDGKSDTSFVAVAIVQVARTQQCPVLCQPVQSQATWIQVVGDPEGSVGGATSSQGFIDHLVTR